MLDFPTDLSPLKIYYNYKILLLPRKTILNELLISFANLSFAYLGG